MGSDRHYRPDQMVPLEAVRATVIRRNGVDGSWYPYYWRHTQAQRKCIKKEHNRRQRRWRKDIDDER